MSCYLCGRKTWTKVLEAWRRNGEALRTIPTDEEINKAWDAIIGANIKAVKDRYPEAHEMWELDEHDIVPPKMKGASYGVIIEKGAGFCDASDAELFEAIQDYQYQVSDAENYHNLEGYYKCQWCKDDWLRKFFKVEY